MEERYETVIEFIIRILKDKDFRTGFKILLIIVGPLSIGVLIDNETMVIIGFIWLMISIGLLFLITMYLTHRELVDW